MNLLKNSLKLIFLLALFSSLAFTQTDPAPTPDDTPDLPALSDLKAGTKFNSIKGKFTVALPNEGFDLQESTPTAKSKESGETYTWIFKEGVIVINYSDDPDLVIKTEKDYADAAEGMRTGITVFGGKVISDKAITLGKFRGFEAMIETAEGQPGVSRFYIVGGRTYSIMAMSSPQWIGGLDKAMTRVLESFTLTTSKAAPKRVPAKKTVPKKRI